MASSSKPPTSVTTNVSNKRSVDDVLKSDEEPAATAYDRFFVIKSNSVDKPLFKLSPFVVEKAFKAAVGTAQNVRRLRDGNILVEVATAAQSRKITQLETLADCPITVSPHRSLNTCKGVIRCRELIDCAKDEILEGLESQGVIDIFNITVKNESGGRRNTNTFIVTFRLTTIPKHIKVGLIRIPVSLYIPNPLRCFNCNKYGHGKSSCKGRAVCAKCGQGDHDSDNCTNEFKCVNCSGSHPAFSKDCPKWLLEKKVQQIKAEQGISFIEARRIAVAQSEGRTAQGHRTAAAVVASSSSSARPAAHSVQVQTDLTWPDGQDLPSTLPIASTATTRTTSSTTQTSRLLPSGSGGGADGGGSASRRLPSRPPAPTASASGNSPTKPPRQHHKPPVNNKPRITRPPKTNSQARANKYRALEMDMEAEDHSASDSDFPNPFDKG